MAIQGDKHFTLYTSIQSQWVGVPHLTLLEKGYKESEYDLQEISLSQGENFKPEYIAINPMGTVPSLTSTSLANPLVDSRDILAYLDRSKDSPEGHLLPTEPKQEAIVGELISQAHSDDISTNVLLFMARNSEELGKNRQHDRHTFLHNRQQALEKYRAQAPEHNFYAPKMEQNGAIDHMYETQDVKELEEFFRSSQRAYQTFIGGFQKLDDMLILPYAAGDKFTAADIHIAPWLSHAMMAVGTDDINDFQPLERHLQKSSPEFAIGQKTREWWSNMNQRPSFREFYPKPH